uniref:Angel homolog 1 (Drosophila) n=1 Tax=Sphaeramia orbicularis TaxID=375764 RepID=A0A673BDT4_9TELE
MDKEQSTAVLLKETPCENLSEKVLSVPTEEEAGIEDENQQDEVVTSHHELPDLEQNMYSTTFTSEVIRNEQPVLVQLEGLKIDDTEEKSCCPMQKQEEIPSLRALLTLSGNSCQETIHPEQKKTDIHGVKEAGTKTTKTAAEVTECWDEYIAPADYRSGENSSEVLFTPLVCDTQTSLTRQSEQHNTQIGYHFPVGLGLAEEVQCPLWQFPAGSYYPPLEQSAPFEGLPLCFVFHLVMWRIWENMDEGAATEQPALIPFPFKKTLMEFTVMSYNILAQDLLEANQDLYTHCPLEVLEWSFRVNLLLEEIQRCAPDILCLQEVQENYYYEQLEPVLSHMGYTCLYKRRTGSKTDGCATCYRSSYFSEVSVIKVEYFRPEIELLDRHNVAIIVVLQPLVIQDSEVLAKGPPLCVANTHLLFNPGRGDVKLAQLAILLAEIDVVVKSCKAKGEHCNIILCGDFNSVPHMPLYQLITTGELYFQGLPAWMISGQEDLSYKSHCYKLFAPLWPSSLGITDSCQYTSVHQESERKLQYSHKFLLQLRFCPAACARPQDLEMIPGVTDNNPGITTQFRHTVSHRLDLESAYKHILPGSGSPEVTTLHTDGAATVDYIFYSPKRTLGSNQKDGDSVGKGLKLLGCLSLLSEDVLWSMNGLPNHIFPSDHLSLLAKFQLEVDAAL